MVMLSQIFTKLRSDVCAPWNLWELSVNYIRSHQCAGSRRGWPRRAFVGDQRHCDWTRWPDGGSRTGNL